MITTDNSVPCEYCGAQPSAEICCRALEITITAYENHSDEAIKSHINDVKEFAVQLGGVLRGVKQLDPPSKAVPETKTYFMIVTFSCDLKQICDSMWRFLYSKEVDDTEIYLPTFFESADKRKFRESLASDWIHPEEFGTAWLDRYF